MKLIEWFVWNVVGRVAYLVEMRRQGAFTVFVRE